MYRRILRHIPLLTRLALTGGGLLYGLAFLYVVAHRISFPYELEWMEGGAVDHVRWILAGNPLYGAPALSFVPFIYTPLYFYVSAAVSTWLGTNLFSLRLVSVLASLACFVVIYLIVIRESKSALSGLFATGLFAATFKMGGAWFDIARVDMLSLALLLGGVYLVRLQPSNRPWLVQAAAALLVFLAFFTKQAALAGAVALCLSALFRPGKSAKLVFPLVFLALLAASTLLMNLSSAGWYSFYVFDLPNQHALHWDMLPQILLDELLFPLWGMILLGGFYLLYILYHDIHGAAQNFHVTGQHQANLTDSVFHLCFSGSLLGASLLARMHAGGYINVLIPIYAAIAIDAGLGLAQALAWATARIATSKSPNTPASYLSFLLCTALLLLGGWQFYHLRYDPRQQIPDRADVLAGDALIERIRNIQGEVFIPYHGYLPALAGKNTYAQGMAMEDIFRSTSIDIRDALKAEISAAIVEKRFSAIILDGEWRFVGEINDYYTPSEVLLNSTDLMPKTGMPTHPQDLYLPRKSVP